MNIRAYNTLSGAKEVLEFPGRKPLRIFVCGPTVYDHAHIGHARTYIAFDAFVRYLRSLKHNVFYLQNITDIDDKIITRAWSERASVKAVAAKYLREYLRDMKDLGVTSVSAYAKATDHIPQIIAQVKKLIKSGFAYEIPGDGYYFDISKFPHYGKLARRTVFGAEDAVSRIDENFHKRNKGDFCLWKFSKPDEPMWPSPFGAGRPGWHIEDTAISEHHFGPQYDIHGGAIDLKFPHHEAEIAQQESASGKRPFVRIWMHTGFLLVEGKKMSKSSHNFITIKEFLGKHSQNALRLFILSYHYRSPVDYSDPLASDYERSWQNMLEFFGKLLFLQRTSWAKQIVNLRFSAPLKKSSEDFHAALADDFNTPKALASLFGLVGTVQPKIWHLGEKESKEIYGTLTEHLETLGFSVLLPKIPAEITRLANAREKVRTNKQFVQSDVLRKKINDLGYKIEDTPLGPFVWPENPR